ncbi:MAG: hypothetical protein ACTSRL_03090 [Candidatus Helarchaeota archaeon]
MEILETDETLRTEILKERENLLNEAQQASQNQQYGEAIKLFQRALEFSLKLKEKKEIWKISKKITLLEDKMKAAGQPIPLIDLNIPKIEISEEERESKPPLELKKSPKPIGITTTSTEIETITPKLTLQTTNLGTPTPQLQSKPLITTTPINPPSEPDIVVPIPQIKATQPELNPPIPQIQTESTFSQKREPDEVDDSFLDSLVADLHSKPKQLAPTPILPSEEAEELEDDKFLDTIVADLKKEKEVQPPIESTVKPLFPASEESLISPKDTTLQAEKKPIPFLQEPIELQETEVPGAAESKVKDIHEIADKKLKKKLALAEKVAMKKLAEAEKQFAKQLKKEEKKKAKELKKEKKVQPSKEDKKKIKGKDKEKAKKLKKSKKDEKLKSKYKSPLPEDVLSEIREKKQD